MKLFQKASAAVLAVCGVLSAVPGAQAAGLQDLPGQELWQPYLNAAPQDADSFVHDPVGALLSLLPASPLEMIRQMVHCYADVLLFLLLLILLFKLSKVVSVLSMKNQELAMQVSLLNQENERILHRLGILTDEKKDIVRD